MSAKESIDALMAHHDDDLENSARQLFELVPEEVESADLRRLSWLVLPCELFLQRQSIAPAPGLLAHDMIDEPAQAS
jgi:hypothetical protein